MQRRLRLLGSFLLGTFLLAALALAMDGMSDRLFPADLAVVLGNRVEPDGEPSPRLAARLDRALELFRDGTVPRILVSGGVGIEGWNEAVVMKRYLVARGVPEEAVFEDPQGIDTLHTARATADFMRARGLQKVIVVTQFYHVPRTRLALRKLGTSQVGGARARYHDLRDLWSLAREIPAYLYYWLS